MAAQATSFFTLFLVFGSLARCYAQEEYPSEQCAAAQKLKAIAQYDVGTPPGAAKPKRLLIERFFYDSAGHNTQWRQYEVRDSARYSTRTFSYDAQGHLLKTVDLSEDGTDGTIDSTRTDGNGRMAYRRLYRPSGEVLFEALFTTELDQRQQLAKALVFDKQKQLQGYTLFTYNPANKLATEASYSASKALQQQRTYSYYPDGTTQKTAQITGSRDTTETKKFTPTGLLAEETHFSQERRGAIDYKNIRKYDSQQREVEQLTYSNYFGAGSKLVLSRREVSQYADSCLKTRTLIFTADINGEESLTVIFDYRYTYYD